MNENTLNQEQLLKNTGWLRTLARTLIQDAAQADDLVQQTFLEAIKKPPAAPKAVRSWLSNVLRNFARRHHRSKSRRIEREKKAARPEHIDASQETLLERVELQQLLLSTVSELNEPYRSTVLLRFFEDCSVRKIAALQKISPETVKTRLRRALEKLRLRLDGTYHGNRRSWCLALMPLVERSFTAPVTGASTTGAGAGAAAHTAAGGITAVANPLSLFTIGGLLMTYKTALTVAGAGLISIAVGWGIGSSTASVDREEAMELHQLVPQPDYDALKQKYDAALDDLNQAESRNAGLRKEREDLALQLTELKKAHKTMIAERKKSAAAPSRLPVPFGKYSELDAVKNADWHDLGQAVSNIHRYIQDMIASMEQGKTPPADTQVKIMEENKRLQKLAGGLMGNIPTHRTGNGEFTHPLILSNIMTAMLDNAELPLTAEQRDSITAIGSEFDKEYDLLQKSYTEETLNLEKFMDELALKHNIMEDIFHHLSPEQYSVVAPENFHGYQSVDCLSPALMTVLLSHPQNKESAEAFSTEAPKYFSEKYELNEFQRDEAGELFQIWYKDIAPNLKKPVDNGKIPLHIDRIITAGNAKIELLNGLLKLPDLSETTVAAIKGDISLMVPRIVQKPAGETGTTTQENE